MKGSKRERGRNEGRLECWDQRIKLIKRLRIREAHHLKSAHHYASKISSVAKTKGLRDPFYYTESKELVIL